MNQEEYRNSKRLVLDDDLRHTLNEMFKEGSLRVVRGAAGRNFLHVYRGDKQERSIPCARPDIGPWLVSFVEDKFRTLLNSQQKILFTDFVIGKGRAQAPDEIENEHQLSLLDASPTMTAVAEFMRDKSDRVEDSMAHLWSVLKKLAKEGHYLQLGGQKFPKSAAALSRRLKAEQSSLAAIGFRVELRRSNGSQVVLTKQVDADGLVPSETPSAPNPSAGEGLPAERTADDIDTYLSNRIRQKVDGVCSLVKQGEDV